MIRTSVVVAALFTPAVSYAQDQADTPASHDDYELAKKLTNPIATIISVPVQTNADYGMGTNGDGAQYEVKLEPVVPFSLTDDWNLISRTLFPIMYQQDVMPQGDVGGIGDTLETLFVSPEHLASTQLVWGVGPAVSIPTATNEALGSGKLSIGPEAVVLRHVGGWTFGALAYHIVSVAGAADRAFVNETYLQPFIHYTSKSKATLSLNSESFYDWESRAWTAPLNLDASQLFRVSGVPMKVALGPRLYVAAPMAAANWGVRLELTFLLPR